MRNLATIKLGDILEYEQPTKYIVKDTNYNNKYKTPVLTAGKTFILGYTNEKENIYKKNLPVIIFDDFTTAIKYVDFPFKVKSSAMKILHTDENIADIKYLFYYMTTIKSDTELHKRYWISQYAHMGINLPPLNIQMKIANILDKATNLINLRKQQLEKLDLLIKSKFIDMFGDPLTNPKKWDQSKFYKEFFINSGGTPSTKEKKYWDNGTVSWIGSNLCQNKILYSNDNKFITELGLSNSSAKIFGKDTVLVALVGATIGKVALLKFSTATNQNVAGISIKNKNLFSSEFVFYYLQGLYQKFMDIGSNKFKMANLTFIKNLPVLTPPVKLQNEFAEFVKEIEKQKLLVNTSLEKLELLYKSLMQKYFENTNG
ncbi:hypothetical protein MASR1M68_11320 [Elusimicrobiota bacterium]